MRLHVKAFALTCGLVWGLGLFFLTWWIIALDGASSEVPFLGRIYRGYTLSAAGSVRLLREARQRGLPVSGEACPHHFVLTDAEVATLRKYLGHGGFFFASGCCTNPNFPKAWRREFSRIGIDQRIGQDGLFERILLARRARHGAARDEPAVAGQQLAVLVVQDPARPLIAEQRKSLVR